MDHHEDASFDSFKRISDFGEENAADFLPVPPSVTPTKAQTLFLGMNEVLTKLTKASNGQLGGGNAGRSGTAGKAAMREAIKATMRGIHTSAEAIGLADNDPEVLKKFPLTFDHNEKALAAEALAFADAAEPMAAKFIDLGHAPDFVQALRGQVSAFGKADTNQNLGQQQRSGSTKEIDVWIHNGYVIAKQLNAIMGNLYKDNAEKMGEWVAASHVERSHKKAADATPTPTPPTP